MSMFRASTNLLLAGAALCAALATGQGEASARAIPAVMGTFNTAEINGVKREDCIVAMQSGTVTNTCQNNMDYYIPLPIDTAGKKSVRVSVLPFRDGVAVSPPPVVPITCTVWATDEGGGTLVLAQGTSTREPKQQSITIGSHPVPANGRLHLACVMPHRSKISTVNYDP